MTDIFNAHANWTKVKSSAMKRPYLDCGCRNDGRDTFLHLGCPRIACGVHAEDPHECDHYEPQAPAREEPAVPDVLLEVTPGVIDEVDRVLRNVAALSRPTRCCDLHGRNCEQGGEECCDDCTERLHFAPNHGGLECSAPALRERTTGRTSPDGPVAGTAARPLGDGGQLRTALANARAEDYWPPRIEVDESLPPNTVDFRDPTTGRILVRLTNVGEPAQPEPDAAPVDAVLQPDPDDPNVLRVRRSWWWVW